MIYIFFVGFGLCLLFTPQKALLDETLKIKEVTESDDDKLSQALILVDILKTEYVKLLRQNIQLRNGDESVIEEVEQSTCAANATEAPDVTLGTTNETNGIQSAAAESSTDGSAPLPAASPPAPAQASPLGPSMTTPAAMAYYDMPMPAQLPFPLHQKQLQTPHRYFHRRIPDYYYYDLPRRRFFNEPPVLGQLQRVKIAPYYRKAVPRGSDFRRFDYDNDPFNDTPTTVLTTPTISTTTSAAITTAASTTSTQATTRIAQGSSNATTPTTMATTTKAPPVKTSPTKTNPPFPPTPTASSKPKMTTATVTRRRSVRTTASTYSPETDVEPLKGNVHHTPSLLTTKDPVDAEVASELVKELKQEGIPLKKLKWKSSSNPTTDIFDPAFKTSMRIFLEKSTRYPIPLPENHAFCYTNPNNPLCRTLIR